jgi:hypothetical protein
VDEPRRDVEEPALDDLDALLAVRAEVEACAAADEVAGTSRSPWWCQPEAMPPSTRARTRSARSVVNATSRTIPAVASPAASAFGATTRMRSFVGSRPSAPRRADGSAGGRAAFKA